MGKYINQVSTKFPIHQLSKQVDSKDLMEDFDCTSLYLSAIRKEKSFYLGIETGYAFTKIMKNDLVDIFNNQTFKQGKSFLKTRLRKTSNLVIQHFLPKEWVNKIDFKRIRNGYKFDIVADVDIDEIVETGGKVIENSRGCSL